MAYIAGVSGGIEFQEEKSADITLSANWSGAYTNYSEINPDTGYDAMEKVKVRTPMLRDYTLMNVSQVDTPGTVYDGNTSRSNSAKMLRVAPSKDGMSYTNSYLEVPASSVMGNATTADVASGKTFSSGNGIALTGTGQMAEDIKNQSLFFGTGMHSGAYSVYDPDVGDYIDINENILQLVSRQDGMVHRTGGGTIWMRKNQYLGDAAASDVLSGKKFSSANGIQIQGSITTRSASSETISEAKTYQAGYYPSGWTVTPGGSKPDYCYTSETIDNRNVNGHQHNNFYATIYYEDYARVTSVSGFVIDNDFVTAFRANPYLAVYWTGRMSANAGTSGTFAYFNTSGTTTNSQRLGFNYSKRIGATPGYAILGYYAPYSSYDNRSSLEVHMTVRLEYD